MGCDGGCDFTEKDWKKNISYAGSPTGHYFSY